MGRVGVIAAFASHGGLTGGSLPDVDDFAASDARGALAAAVAGIAQALEFEFRFNPA
jgi:hypothetical protein